MTKRDADFDDLPDISDAVEEAVLEIIDSSDSLEERERRITEFCAEHVDLEVAIRLWLTGLDDPGTLDERGALLASGCDFGSYNLREKLGAGGMGVVYLALDRRLGRQVAIKILPSHRLADETSRRRFEREAKAVAALAHPAIVPVYEVGEVDGVPYFTMEYVPGLSLDAVIVALKGTERSVMSLTSSDLARVLSPNTVAEGLQRRSYQEAVCRLVIDVADALEHAHQNNVVHRDVKPSNIIASAQGGARLFDFGLAWLEGSLEVTQTSDLLGSPCYMSPEQVSKRSPVDGRTDVYSLGVTLYQLLTLQLPFPDQDLDRLLQRILKSEPVPIRKSNPNVGRDLETICLTAMEKVPARRYQSALEMADDLRRFLRFEPVTARPVSAMTRSFRWLHRHPALVAIVLLVQVVSIVLFLLLYFAGQLLVMEPKLKQSLETLETRKAEEREKNLLIALQTKRLTAGKAELQVLVRQYEAKGQQLEAQRNALAAETRLLEGALLGAKEAESRRAAAEETSGQLDAQLETNREMLAGLRLERDRLIEQTGTLRGNRLLAEAMKELSTEPGLGLALATRAADEVPGVLADNTLLELLVACHEIREFGEKENVIDLDFSPDGSRVVTISVEYGVRVWDTESGALVAEFLLANRDLLCAEFSTDTVVLLADEQRSIYLWDLESGARPARVPSARHYEGAFRHTSPNRQVFVARISHKLDALGVWDLRAGVMQPKLILGGHTGVVRDVSFSPSGRYLVTSAGDARARIWDLERGAESLDWLTQPSRALCVAFADHAHEVAVLDAAGHLKVWDLKHHHEVFSLDLPVADSSGTAGVEFVDRDRNLIVELGHRTVFVSRQSRRVIRELAHEGVSFGRGARSPDGRVWVERAGDGSVGVWDTASGERLTVLSGHRLGGVHSRSLQIAFRPEANQLMTGVGRGRARLWGFDRGGRLPVCDLRLSTELPGQFTAASFDASGQMICAVTDRGAVTYWAVADGMSLGVSQGDVHEAGIAVFDPVSRRAMTVQAGLTRVVALRDGVLQAAKPMKTSQPVQLALWSAGRIAQITMPENRKRQMILKGVTGTEHAVALPGGLVGGGVPVFSVDGRWALCGYRELGLVDLTGGVAFQTLPGSEGPAVFSGDSALLLTSRGFGASLWRVGSAEPMAELSSGGGAKSALVCAEFSSDRALVVTGWSDGLVCVHEVVTGRRLLERQVHRDAVLSVDLSPDGRTLLVAGQDDGVNVLGLEQLVTKLSVPGAVDVLSAQWNDQGTSFLVAQKAQIWVVPLDILNHARAVLPREFTVDELRRYQLPVTALDRVDSSADASADAKAKADSSVVPSPSGEIREGGPGSSAARTR